MFYGAETFDQPLVYCKWQSNTYFTNANDACEGTLSCGWGLSECPFVCVDSPLEFQVETVGGSLLPFSCKMAKKKEDKLTCSDQGQVATHCPKACDKCSEHKCSDAEGVFFMGDGGEKKLKCSRLKKMTEDKRSRKCRKTNVAQTCRETCKLCE